MKKSVEWRNYAFLVPEEANWIAFDEDGSCYWYIDEPNPAFSIWYRDGYTKRGKDRNYGFIGDDLITPEKGDWHTQLYAI